MLYEKPERGDWDSWSMSLLEVVAALFQKCPRKEPNAMR
jgi:hypothetical protein